MHEKIIGGTLPEVTALAYIGDARHSLYIRTMLVNRGVSRSKDLNAMALSYVTAEAQAKAYSKIENILSEDEREVFKRAFNSTHLNKPKRASGKDYRTATGFEAIIGMLSFIKDEDRIEELLTLACSEKGEIENDSED